MNYQALVYFKTVAELQHFTRAANALYITQPALSKSIHNLEVELGTALFEKDGRNVALTPCGALFYKYVKNSVEQIDEGLEAVRQLSESKQNTIAISALQSLYASLLPEKITRFRGVYPDCKFLVEYKGTSSIIPDILNGKSDVGICSDFYLPEDETRIDRIALRTEPLVIIVGKNHPLAKQRYVSIEKLRDERFIVYIRSDFGTNRVLKDMCRSAGFEPNIVTEAYTDYALFGMVSANEGISIVSEMCGISMEHVVALQIDKVYKPVRTIYAIWNNEVSLNPLKKAFIKMLCN